MLQRFRILVGLLAAVAVVGENAVADIYITHVGEGASALSSAATPVSIRRYSDTGTLLQTIPLPTAASGGNNPLLLSGTSTTEGGLGVSANGLYLTIGGISAVPGNASPGQTMSTTNPRVIGRITIADNSVDTTTALTDAYNWTKSGDSSGSVRSVVSDTGNEFWIGGTAFITPGDSTSAGVRYATLGATTSTAITAFPYPSNTRSVDIFNGQLYMSSMTGVYRGVSTVGTGLPTTLTNPPNDVGTILLEGMNPTNDPNSPEDAFEFWFKDTTTLYVADNRAAGTGGIHAGTSMEILPLGIWLTR